MQKPLILVINLGATSSKFALYKGDESLCEQSIPLADEYAKLPLADQRGERLNQLNKFIADSGIEPESIQAVAARG